MHRVKWTLFIEVLENTSGSLNTEGNAKRNFRNMPGHCAMKKKLLSLFSNLEKDCLFYERLTRFK